MSDAQRGWLLFLAFCLSGMAYGAYEARQPPVITYYELP